MFTVTEVFTEKSLKSLSQAQVQQLARDASPEHSGSSTHLASKFKYGLCQIYGYSGVARDVVAGLDNLFDVLFEGREYSGASSDILMKKQLKSSEYERFYQKYYAIAGTVVAVALANTALLSKAQTILGVCYILGIGVVENDIEAVRLYQLAAMQGNAVAQCNLGGCYSNGVGGLVKNEEETVRLYQLAADQGNALAQNNLGICYATGFGGLVKNAEEMVRLLQLAAAQRNALAQYNLGICYANGICGLIKDEVAAVRLLKLAAAQGHLKAIAALERFDSQRHAVTAEFRSALAANAGSADVKNPSKRMKVAVVPEASGAASAAAPISVSSREAAPLLMSLDALVAVAVVKWKSFVDDVVGIEDEGKPSLTLRGKE